MPTQNCIYVINLFHESSEINPTEEIRSIGYYFDFESAEKAVLENHSLN